MLPEVNSKYAVAFPSTVGSDGSATFDNWRASDDTVLHRRSASRLPPGIGNDQRQRLIEAREQRVERGGTLLADDQRFASRCFEHGQRPLQWELGVQRTIASATSQDSKNAAIGAYAAVGEYCDHPFGGIETAVERCRDLSGIVPQLLVGENVVANFKGGTAGIREQGTEETANQAS